MTKISLLIFALHFYYCMSTNRVVVTFQKKEYNNISNISYLSESNITIQKQYGRRLVLDFQREVQYVQDSKYIIHNLSLENIEQIELDSKVDTSSIEYQNASNNDFYQWNLFDDYGININNSWQKSNSTKEVVVAILDTGIAYQAHSLFESVVPGYDFISDSSISLDSDGRDFDSTDPGTNTTECPTPSWHGTQMASIMASKHNDQENIKGIAWNCSIMHLRVLGKCTQGYSNDIADAIVFAAGGTINGLETNIHRAHIISMSFSGRGTCPSYLQSAINQAASLGSILIAAAGNNNQNSDLFFPANCDNVIVVSASIREGILSDYSNYNENAISAPGGDQYNMIPVMTLDTNNALIKGKGIGTSYAAAHISGILAIWYDILNVSDSKNNKILFQFIKIQSKQFYEDCDRATCGIGIINSYIKIAKNQEISKDVQTEFSYNVSSINPENVLDRKSVV